MNQTLHKILTGLTVLLLFPVAIATFYEYSRINDNEELISTVYQNQLETIVSSINTYAQDVAGNWSSRIDLWLMYPSDDDLLQRLGNENPSILGLYTSKDKQPTKALYTSPDHENRSQLITKIQQQEAASINQLLIYYENNYRKLLSHSPEENAFFLFFVGKDRDNEPVVCFIELDLQLFLQNHVGPRMQSIAQENFIIGLQHQPSGSILLTSEGTSVQNLRFDQEGEMWLFPQIKIGISLKQQTISDLASSRVKEGLLLIGMVLVVLIAGVWFLYSSVKKEIQLAQIKSEFISNVSHEIRTPLALISMYIETLEMGRVKTVEKVQEYYKIIGTETHRLSSMVDKILSFSKIESGKRIYKSEICNLNLITEQILETYHFHLNNKNFHLQFSPEQPLPNISGDKEAIADAIINLIDNGIKYSRDIKKIDISTGIEKRKVYIEVKDYGRGIAKKDQKLVFDKFFRVTNQNLANEVKGTGLGLSIVQEIVKAHKGKITLTSKPDAGSTFRLYFPILHKPQKTDK
jgi:two-component system, OmpR family, phosphate regulon sensor histidine kinase PhoR